MFFLILGIVWENRSRTPSTELPHDFCVFIYFRLYVRPFSNLWTLMFTHSSACWSARDFSHESDRVQCGGWGESFHYWKELQKQKHKCFIPADGWEWRETTMASRSRNRARFFSTGLYSQLFLITLRDRLIILLSWLSTTSHKWKIVPGLPEYIAG